MARANTAVFTICSNNYLPYARTLLASLRVHHPETDLFICLVDEKLSFDGIYPSDCEVLLPEELGIPEFESFAFQYDIMELNTAVKPFVFLKLFERGYERVVYFDPDIELFSRLDSVFAALDRRATFVLTPHLCSPAENDAQPGDVGIMRAGIYNLGFVACTNRPDTTAVMQWWARRLQYQCIVKPDAGIFVDQKFVDLIPGFADDCAILRDPTLNVAYWNLLQRSLTQDNDRWLVEGLPLGFFHYSGITPGRFEYLSKHSKNFRSEAITAPIRALMEHYFRQLAHNGLGQMGRGDYLYDRFPSGTPINILVRRMFRERHLPWSGNPFQSYEEFLHLPSPGTSRHSSSYMVTNLMKFIWDEFPWAQQNFDFKNDLHVESFVRWYAEHGSSVLRLDPRLVEPVIERAGRQRYVQGTEKAGARVADRPDVTVVGYLKMAGGTGEAGRQTLRALATTDLQVDGHDVSTGVLAKRDDDSCDSLSSSEIAGRVQIFHVNADQLPIVLDQTRPQRRDDAYRVAVPFWELAEFPEAWYPAMNDVDEIWAPSRFIQTALFRKIRKPITYMPIALSFEAPKGFDRSYFGLPEKKFLYFFAFDFLSFQARKNPRGVYRAFCEFRRRQATNDVGLVVKSLNGIHASGELAELHAELSGDPDVTFIDRSFSRTETLGLIGLCDCVISLHRSEGLGLLIAEAMMLGKPVIATDYSATTALVNPTTGYPVNYQLIPVEKGQYPHAAGEWADPDIDHAVWLMRLVRSDPATVQQKVREARTHTEESFGIARVAALQRRRLSELGLV